MHQHPQAHAPHLLQPSSESEHASYLESNENESESDKENEGESENVSEEDSHRIHHSIHRGFTEDHHRMRIGFT